MKKLLLVALLFVSLVALAACDGDGDEGRTKTGATPQINTVI